MKFIPTLFLFLFFNGLVFSQCTTTNATSCECVDGKNNCLLLPDITASWQGIADNGWTDGKKQMNSIEENAIKKAIQKWISDGTQNTYPSSTIYINPN